MEELLFRLFLVSLLAFILGAGWRRHLQVPGIAIAFAIVAAAVIFGLGHLPYASFLVQGPPSALNIARTVLLNGIGRASVRSRAASCREGPIILSARWSRT